MGTKMTNVFSLGTDAPCRFVGFGIGRIGLMTIQRYMRLWRMNPDDSDDNFMK